MDWLKPVEPLQPRILQIEVGLQRQGGTKGGGKSYYYTYTYRKVKICLETISMEPKNIIKNKKYYQLQISKAALEI